MVTAIKVCRVCGKEYPACHSARKSSCYNWQEVACSPECGEKYLAAVLEARGDKPVAESAPVKKTRKSKSEQVGD